MKPSELKGVKVSRSGAPSEPDEPLPYRRSELAAPLITPQEARAASISICRHHNGRIASLPTQDDHEGRVYFCPIGAMYWRYSKRPNDFWRPLDYPRLA